jgi:hypothetical protein
MKTEYLLTSAQKAELADIDRQIAELCKRKAEIYAFCNCRYIPETKEEIDGVLRMKEWLYSGIDLFPKERIANLKFEEEDDGTI